jgi:hypothetical protein
MSYRLLFSMRLPTGASEDFPTGYLQLLDDERLVLQVRATSGQRGSQYLDHYWQTSKSPIPASIAIQGEYHVNLNWVDPGNLASAMGSRFYGIYPNPVYSLDGSQRRVGIGLHYDANYVTSPGSAGCIMALPRTPEDVAEGRPGWNAMKAELDKIRAAGISEIGLTVEYEGTDASRFNAT